MNKKINIQNPHQISKITFTKKKLNKFLIPPCPFLHLTSSGWAATAFFSASVDFPNLSGSRLRLQCGTENVKRIEKLSSGGFHRTWSGTTSCHHPANLLQKKPHKVWQKFPQAFSHKKVGWMFFFCESSSVEKGINSSSSIFTPHLLS